MKFSENWLREWVSPEAITTEELVAQLTMAGSGSGRLSSRLPINLPGLL